MNEVPSLSWLSPLDLDALAEVIYKLCLVSRAYPPCASSLREAEGKRWNSPTTKLIMATQPQQSLQTDRMSWRPSLLS